MPKKKSSFLEKALGHIDHLDAEGIHAVVGRLAQEHRFLETLFDTIHDGVIVVDERGAIQYFNRAATTLVGLPSENVINEPIARFVPNLDWESIQRNDHIGGDENLELELEVDYPEERFLRVVAASLDGRSVGSSGVMLVFHDATESRKKTFEAIESERIQALTLLAGSVAHELGNPLHALHIHLQLIDRELVRLREPTSGSAVLEAESADAARPEAQSKTLAKLEKYVSVAKGEITRLDLIVRQFLQAIRPVKPQLKKDDLNRVVRETLELLEPELENRGLEVLDALSSKAAKAVIDADQIKQVLVNLIRNAMQAMTRGGRLTVKTVRDEEGVWLSVEDTGTGISEEEINRIFEPYFTTKKKGTGLGLMIVHRIVSDHHGRILVEPGTTSGTRFRVWLPREPKGPRLLSTSERTSDTESGS